MKYINMILKQNLELTRQNALLVHEKRDMLKHIYLFNKAILIFYRENYYDECSLEDMAVIDDCDNIINQILINEKH